MSNRRASAVFAGMVRRCYNEACKDYRWYGGKGIKICFEWLHVAGAFQRWYESQGGHDKWYQIDRIDSNGDYCPENCALVPPSYNARWKTGTNEFTINGVTKSGKQWSAFLGLGVNHINRYCRKHGGEETLAYIHQLLPIAQLNAFKKSLEETDNLKGVYLNLPRMNGKKVLGSMLMEQMDSSNNRTSVG